LLRSTVDCILIIVGKQFINVVVNIDIATTISNTFVPIPPIH